MSAFVDVLLRAVFAENLALVFLLGMCTYIAVSKRVETAIGLGIAVIAVQTITVPLNNALYQLLLAPGALDWAGLGSLDLSFLKLVAFIGVIAASVQILEVVMDRFTPALHQTLGIYLPLLTVNCAILGASLFMVQRSYDFVDSIAYGIGSGTGWALPSCCSLPFASACDTATYPQVSKGSAWHSSSPACSRSPSPACPARRPDPC